MPSPARTSPTAGVHPAIAEPLPGASRHGTAPRLQYLDGLWNHAEGFQITGSDADSGGWFAHDDGTGLQPGDIHLTLGGWVPHTYDNVLSTAHGLATERMQGYLRPAGLALPTAHPRYGNVGTYVDQGAFEIFRPANTPYAGQKVLLVIQCFATLQFPGGYDPNLPSTKRRKLFWFNTYRGFFSPDGLARDEFASGFTGNPVPGSSEAITAFQQNIVDGDVDRFQPHAVATWYGHPNQSLYYPIVAYPVLTVMGRQTELNEQRYLQLVAAVKLMLAENTNRNPLGANNPLTDPQIADRLVVVFDGGSNGGQQASWATLRHPEIVHGCYAQVISPSIQRLFGEQDLGWAVAELSGSKLRGATVDASDFLNWGQYCWNQGLEIHDQSFLRQFFAGNTYRPACFMVGDEDLTSTGTDWCALANNVGYSRSGLRQSGSTFGSTTWNTLAWMAAENACHGGGLIEDPYNPGNPLVPMGGETIHDVAVHAINQRAAQLAAQQVPPSPAVTHQPRTQAQQLRGLDDPHEWFYGRGPDAPAVPLPTDPLVPDVLFKQQSQPGAAGTWLGSKEAMFVRDNKVYVGSADGVVSSFAVDLTDARRPLVRVAQSQRLGHRAFGLCSLDQGGGSWKVVAATRRHLFLLDPVTLVATAQSALLPWEVAEPHSLKVGNVLPGSPGDEIVFRSVHGGLVFCDTSLNPIHEWLEPGIQDFLIDGAAITFASMRRGVLAKVVFDLDHKAQLVAASQPLPNGPTDLPSQGVPSDVELMKVNLGGAAFPAIMSLWTGDEDGTAVRVHDPNQLVRFPVTSGTQGKNLESGIAYVGTGTLDIATCKENLSTPIGDHLLLLIADNLKLLRQDLSLVSTMSLRYSGATPAAKKYYPFGSQACSIAVGELVQNSGGYQEEVVIATESGHLVWVHIEDVANATNGLLPAAFDVATTSASGTNTQVQPHTNQALSATWSIALNPNDPGRLQLLDQGGAYWRVDAAGGMELFACSDSAAETKGWKHVGTVGQVSGGLLQSTRILNLFPTPSALVRTAATRPWACDDGLVVFYELAQPGPMLNNNWVLGLSPFGVFGEMFPFLHGGDLLPSSSDRLEVWFWSQVAGTGNGWANHLEGLRIDPSGEIDGMWASTGEPASTIVINGVVHGDLTPFHDLRNVVNHNPAMNYQAARAVEILSLGQPETAVVLGCTGGRVRIVRPGGWRIDSSASHTLGSVESTPYDLGFGGGALAVRVDNALPAPEQVVIWFGSHYGHLPRPAAYGSAQGTLQDSEVAVGEVHRLVWTPGNPGYFSQPTTVRLAPSAQFPRGAYGVTGLLVADLLQQQPGDELIACTMSGDLILLAADTMQEIWRTNVPGAIGFYNSIVVADLDGDSAKELYVAGSQGVWKWTEN